MAISAVVQGVAGMHSNIEDRTEIEDAKRRPPLRGVTGVGSRSRVRSGAICGGANDVGPELGLAAKFERALARELPPPMLLGYSSSTLIKNLI